MILFDERQRRGSGLLERYGLAEAGALMPLPFGYGPTYPEGREDLTDEVLLIRGADWVRRVVEEGATRWETPTDVGPAKRPPRPRLFVSHRRADRACALRVAWLADQAGFDVWIDVLDPVLTDAGRLSDQKAIAIVIEVALLNATHLCAVYTDHTKGSEWVPYEYGRVKDHATMSSRAACCVAPDMQNALPAWADLGDSSGGESDLRRWLDEQWRDWGSALSAPTGDWPASVAEPQALWEGCQPSRSRESA